MQMLRCTTSLSCLATRLELLQPNRSSAACCQYLVLTLRRVAFSHLDVRARAAVARKHVLYVHVFSHVSMKKENEFAANVWEKKLSVRRMCIIHIVSVIVSRYWVILRKMKLCWKWSKKNESIVFLKLWAEWVGRSLGRCERWFFQPTLAQKIAHFFHNFFHWTKSTHSHPKLIYLSQFLSLYI